MPTDVKRRSKLLLSDSMYVEYLFELEDYSSVKQNKKQQRKKKQTNKCTAFLTCHLWLNDFKIFTSFTRYTSIGKGCELTDG